MQHNVSSLLEQPHQAVAFYETILGPALPASGSPAPKNPQRPGRPCHLSWPHLWFALILGILQGVSSYQGFRRLLAEGPLGPFAPVCVTDDAVVKRLKQAGLPPLHLLFERVSATLSHLIGPLFPADLAPFAREILALDESTWDAVERHLPALRQVPKGDSELRAGKLAGRAQCAYPTMGPGPVA
jgi:hypothetical protein